MDLNKSGGSGKIFDLECTSEVGSEEFFEEEEN